MAKRVTISEVALIAGVSKTTVSVVLNGNAEALGIRELTRAHVLDVAAKLGYSPNHAAQALRRQRTNVITLLVQSLANPLFVDLAVHCRAGAAVHGYELNVVDAGRLEAEVLALEHLHGERADGVIVATGRHQMRRPAVDRLISLTDRGTPAVVLIDRSPGAGIPAIRADVEAGSSLAVSHLVGLGHRRIAHIALDTGPSLNDEPSSQGDRYRSYRRVLAEAGIGFDPAWLIRGRDTLAGGFDMARQLLDVRPRPTAVFVYNDLTAIGVLRALSRAGVRVPGDIAVVGFDGIELGAYMNPALSTVLVDTEEMATRGMVSLFALIGGSELQTDVNTVVEAPLIVRESCGGAPGA